MAEAGLAPGPVVPANACTREAGEGAAERLPARDGGLTAIAAANASSRSGPCGLCSRAGFHAPPTFRSVAITGRLGAAAAHHDPHLPRPDRPGGRAPAPGPHRPARSGARRDPNHAGTDRARLHRRSAGREIGIGRLEFLHSRAQRVICTVAGAVPSRPRRRGLQEEA
jgi:hypothetical protein